MSEETASSRAGVVAVGVDGSALSVGALQWAVSYARRTGVEIRAVVAWDVPAWVYITPTSAEEDYEREATAAFDAAVGPVAREAPDVVIRSLVVRNSPGLALVHAARGAELLVVGSHGRGELPHVHLGSVASYCVHHAPCPVLVYRETAAGEV